MINVGQDIARTRIEQAVERDGVAVVGTGHEILLVGRAAIDAAWAAAASPSAVAEHGSGEAAWWAALLECGELANTLCELDSAIAVVGHIPPECPTYGGMWPADTHEMLSWDEIHEMLSWDETHLLVGTCATDLEIVPR